MQKILSAMRRAVQDYDMIHDGDKIFVGLSGGKDSTLLLSALAAYRRFSPEHYDLEAITVDMGLKDTKQEEMDALIAYCDSLGVKHHLIKTDIGEIIFDARKEQNPCSLCAKMRRGALNNEIIRLGGGKLASVTTPTTLPKRCSCRSCTKVASLASLPPLIWTNRA